MKGWPGEPDMEYDVLMADGEAAVNAGKPITDVIFDFGNVLVYWDPVAVMTPRYSDELVEQFLDNDISGFYDINDELTIANGKISGMNINGDNPWWINPWLTRWDNNMADDLSEGTRIAIPVKGDPEMGLAHSSMTPILKGPVTQSDLDGKVDWHLWDSVPMASVGGGCQNPGYCG